MQKQINPDLFGMEITPNTPTALGQASNLGLLGWDSLFQLEQKMAELRQALQEVRDQIALLKKDSSHQQQATEKKIDQIVTSLKILEKNDHLLAQQHQERNQSVSHKLQDLKNTELKIKEMIDHHQMVIRRYDHKIHQLQEIIDQKNQLLEKFRLALQDAQNEIARLKKA
ncbi:MAG: hypothetical protein NZ480_08235 [Bdellovibrionaceae bacterium]|nr:hypothetical protein [Pseudobdellovibrionaceae bacterium]MDW8190452.1 hypothetical protein [Pseudobdellovibrionaceae bacterium]